MTGKLFQPIFIKNVPHQTLTLIVIELFPIRSTNPGGFFPPMLERKKPQVGNLRGLGMPKDSKDTAGVFYFIRHVAHLVKKQRGREEAETQRSKET
jgi:hypothetical protein